MQDIDREKCTIRGYLYGVVCGHLRVWDRIAGAHVFAVPSEENGSNVDSLARPGRPATKQVVRDIDEGKLKKLTAGAMQDATDTNGAFCFENPDYDGELLDIYVCVSAVPTPGLEGESLPLDTPECLYLGTFRPFRFGDTWYLIAVIPDPLWCRIRRKADAWVIVGRVTPCEEESIGLGALDVTAFDTDWLQHDNLGTATTNANGVFRIDYPGSRFRQGTWIDVELFGGPDVYFKVEDQDGNVLLEEAPSRGRSAGRRNRGPCFCVELCVDVDIPPVGVIPSAWTGIGTAFNIPDGTTLQDFDADGYAGAARYAFHHVTRMTGSAPNVTLGGNPVEYRFLVSDTTTPNGAAPPPSGDFSRIVGIGADIGLFSPTKVAKMIRYSPYTVVNIRAELVDLDADGWFDVNAAINRTFAAHPTLTPADIGDFLFDDTDALMAIDTRKLTTEDDVPGSVGQAGDPVPGGDRIGIEKKAVRFEIREVIDKLANVFNGMPGSGTTLNSMVMNNNPAYLKVAMTEHLAGGDPCSPLSGAKPHVAFTAHHPHIRDVNINVRSNDGSYNENLDDTATKPPTSDDNIPVAGNTSETVNHLHNPSVDLPGTMHKCTYIVTLSVLRRLHTGDGAVSANNPQTSFYYEP